MMNKHGYLYLISGLCIWLLLFACASTSKNIDQTDIYDKYLKLTGWDIDILSESEYSKMRTEEAEKTPSPPSTNG